PGSRSNGCRPWPTRDSTWPRRSSGWDGARRRSPSTGGCSPSGPTTPWRARRSARSGPPEVMVGVMTAPHHDVLTTIGVSIVAAAAFALVARTVRQPLILGYILAGAALGPNVGLGLVADEASIELISEMGLIFLLFIIGLEINVPALAQAGRS